MTHYSNLKLNFKCIVYLDKQIVLNLRKPFLNQLNKTVPRIWRKLENGDRPVTVPPLVVLNNPTSLSVLNRPLALFVVRTLKDG